ncbi:MAG: choice-of-anchor J domain-containing protein, partial [Prevotella sp.]|nr:choice-of-anchor J domain-containing protein [Prevotella sp.]
SNRYIAFRHFNCYDQYIMCLDDIELTAGAKDGGERHLEYYKVMCTSIDGVQIYNHNTVYPFCQLSTNEPYNAPLVEGEHYLCKVAVMYSTGMSAWSEPVEWEYEPCDHWGPVDEVTVGATTQGNHIEWVFEHGYNPYDPGTGPVPGEGDAFSVDFEGGMPAGWNVIDANNDGWTWCMTSNIPTTWTYYSSLTLDWYHSGTNAICSGSYINGVGALNPDEYLVSPQVNLAAGSQFSFYAAATDASYAADHFGVFVSDNGTSDWTMVNEWTLTAKGGAKAGDVRATRDGNGNRLGNWYQYTVDLSAFAGQKYIAIRHFNCTDQYIMCVDDIELTAGAKDYNAMASGMLSNGTYAINITDIANFDERVYFLYNLINDVRFDVINGEAAGMFIVSAAQGYEDLELEVAVKDFIYDNANQFSMMDKVQAADLARVYKAEMPASFTNSMMMDIFANSRDNAHCADAYPFCTDEGMYEFPAGVNAGSGEPGPDYDCLYTTPNPAWYYMKMSDPGDMDIYMYSTPSVDIDFCCWGPFADPISPCPNGLTSDKVVSCSYSAQPTEHCMIPASAQTGEYYILVITNYSN